MIRITASRKTTNNGLSVGIVAAEGFALLFAAEGTGGCDDKCKRDDDFEKTGERDIIFLRSISGDW
jgi:hypothetical protein